MSDDAQNGRWRLGRPGRRGMAAALMAAVVLVLLATVAYAAVRAPGGALSPAEAFSDSGPVLVTNSRGGDALVDMRSMKPGDQVSGTVRVGNAHRRRNTRMSVGVSRLQELIGPSGGRLSASLTLDVAQILRGGRYRRVYTGLLCTMPRVDLGTFKPRESRSYRFIVRFPNNVSRLDNRLMGGSVSLQFSWYARPVH